MNDPSITDQHLAARALGKDGEAFQLLYKRYVRRVYAYHLVRTGDEQTAQDLTSETFLAVLDHLSTYRVSGSFGAWLMGIAHHKLVDYYRSQSMALSLDGIADLPAADPLPEKRVTQQDDLAKLSRVLSLLTPERADALSLRYFAQLNFSEVGRVMGKSPAAVKMLVARGLQELRDRLGVVHLEEE